MQIDIREFKQRLYIGDVLDLIKWRHNTRKADQMRGPCPIHGSSQRSTTFSVNLTKGIYHCFKCGAGGNALELYMDQNNIISICAAVERLASALSMEVRYKE